MIIVMNIDECVLVVTYRQIPYDCHIYQHYRNTDTRNEDHIQFSETLFYHVSSQRPLNIDARCSSPRDRWQKPLLRLCMTNVMFSPNNCCCIVYRASQSVNGRFLDDVQVSALYWCVDFHVRKGGDQEEFDRCTGSWCSFTKWCGA